MVGQHKALSILLASIVAISLFPAAAFGLQAGASPSAPTPTVLSTQMVSSAGIAKAKVSKKKIRSLYKNVLKKAVKGKGVFKTQYSHLNASDRKYWWKKSLAYAIYDVDRNGTPEILIQAGCFTYDMCWHMFTVTGKKVKYLGKFGSGSLMAREKSSGVYVWNSRQGHLWMYFVTILYGESWSSMTIMTRLN